MSRAKAARSTALWALVSASGCGGAAPLLHPAHVLPEGEVSAGAGLSGQLVTGAPAAAIQAARESTVQGLSPAANGADNYRRGALAIAAYAPGVSPFVGARVGVGSSSEAGITYTGRILRIDARHSFEDETWAFSAGLGAHGLFMHAGQETHAPLAGLGLQGTNGYGLDVPLLGGWRSKAGLFSVWGGGRLGYEHLGGTITLGGLPSGGEDAASAGFSAKRLWGGGVLGLAAGFRHVFVAVEIDALVHHATASFASGGADLTGVSIAPAGALIGKF